jgi:pimeloyl-ACP methyl ester carboxylesterase
VDHLVAASLALAAALAAGWAHYLFWCWRLRAPGLEDERLHAVTADGWRLCLGRRRPRGARRGEPILMIHGIAMNRLALDFGVERLSLSACLAAAGFDCFALDLRGHGGSRDFSGTDPGAGRDWDLDDYLGKDLPAAMDAVAEATGSSRVVLLGHSQGALLSLAAAVRYPGRVAAVVALAPPVRFTAGAARVLRALPWLAASGLTRFGARLLAPFVGPWQPRSVGISIQAAEMERPVFRRLMANVVEDLPRGVVAQFAAFVREGRLGSRDGAEDWRARLPDGRAPALFVAAPEDGIATPEIVREAHGRWGGEKALELLPAGIGHTDMLLGRRAPAALFPVVRAWLLARS